MAELEKVALLSGLQAAKLLLIQKMVLSGARLPSTTSGEGYSFGMNGKSLGSFA